MTNRSPLHQIRLELEEAAAQLREHLASWEYAFAMGSSHHGATAHPTHRATRERTEHLRRRCHDLEARLAEYECDTP